MLYYVDAARPDDAGAGTSWALAKKTIAAGVALVGPGDTLYIRAGTYPETSGSLVSAKAGTAVSPVRIIGGVDGETIYNGAAVAANHLRITGSSYVSVEGITFINPDNGARNAISISSTASNTTVSRCVFRDPAVALEVSGAGTVIDGVTVLGGMAAISSRPVRLLAGSAGATVRNSVFAPSVTGPHRGIESYVAATLEHNTMAGAQTAHLHLMAAVAVTSINNIYVAPGSGGAADIADGYVVGLSTAGSSVASTNDLFLPIGLSSDTAHRSLVRAGGASIALTAPVYRLPQFREWGHVGYVFLTMDDSPSVSEARDLADQYYNPRGLKLVVAPQTYEIEQGTISHEDAVAFINAGNDIACHSYSHVQLNTLQAITITGPTAASQVTIATDTSAADSDDWTGTITVLEGGVVQGTYPLATKLQNVLTWLHGRDFGEGAWAAAWPAGVTQTAGGAKATALAPVVEQSVAAATTFSFADAAFYFVEVAEAAANLQGWIRAGATGRAATYVVKALMAPGNLVSDTARDRVAAAGLLGMRGGQTATSDPSHNNLAAFYPFDWRFVQDTTLRTFGAGFRGTSVTFSAATKEIVVAGQLVQTANGLEVGDSLTVQGTTHNDGLVVTIAALVEAGGNTTITVDEAVVDEAAASAVFTCEAKFKRNVASLLAYAEVAGHWVEIMSHSIVTALGWTELEHQWFAEAVAESGHALRYSINDVLDLLWSGQAGWDGNAWTEGAGSKAAPDHTLRLDHTHVEMGNFRLRASSPAIRAGSATATATTDYDGRARPAAGRDIGAFQFRRSGGGLIVR